MPTLDRIECSASFQIHEGYWFKAFWGGTIAPTEDAETETLKLKDRLEEMAKKFGASPRQVSIAEALPVEKPIANRADVLINDIHACTEIDRRNSVGVQVGLLAYEHASKSDPRIKAAYDLKMIQLKK